MPSRPLLQPPITTHNHHLNHHYHHLLLLVLPLIITLSILLLLFLLLYLYFTLLHSTPKTLPFSTSPPPINPTPTKFTPLHRFSHRQLRRATNNFHPSTSLGRGAYASVFLANVTTKQLAVKVLNPSNSEETLNNEIRLFSSVVPPSPFVVSLVGYAVKKKKKKTKKKEEERSEIGRKRSPAMNILVYEYMKNGSLQEALFGSPESESPVLKWEQRFQIILDIAQGIAFLHTGCEPPVIHGDIKPSNVLLGPDFHAKISDFGLSRLKFDDDGEDGLAVDDGIHQNRIDQPVDFAVGLRASSSIASKKKTDCSKGKETVSMITNCEEELFSVDYSKELSGNIAGFGSSPAGDEMNPASIDWWWRQDESGELWSRDYVSEWIGSQISPVTDPDWGGENLNGDDDGRCGDINSRCRDTKCSPAKLQEDSHRDFTPIQLVRNREQQEKVIAVEEEGGDEKKHKKMRDWWKEEYLSEIIAADNKKQKKKKFKFLRRIRIRSSKIQRGGADDGAEEEETLDFSFKRRWSEKKKRSQSCSGVSDIFSGDLFSRELSSTTSMRGTICYVAPESSGGGHFMEKTDIYSFGVLILVIVSGRRPLHVLSSPMKLERANLITWCRQLAHSGDVLDLVDERLRGEFDKEKSALCINLGLLCLQRLPELRPDSSEIVKILKGEMDLPGIPVEFSHSPPSKRVAGRSRRKPKSELD